MGTFFLFDILNKLLYYWFITFCTLADRQTGPNFGAGAILQIGYSINMTNKDDFSAENLFPEELQRLGAAICLRRVKLGLSQRDLVNETFYERLLNEVESGRVAPSNDLLTYLAESLGTSPQELLGIKPALPPPDEPGAEESETAALELALMNAHVQMETDRPDAALAFLQPYTDNPAELPLDLRPVFYRVRGQARLEKKEYQRAEADLYQAFELLDQAEPLNVLQREVVRNSIASLYYRQYRVEEALKLHRESLEAVLEHNIPNRRFRLTLYAGLANDHYLLGRHDLALSIYKNDALSLAEQGEDDVQVAHIYWGIGLIHKTRKEYGQAVQYLSRSVKNYEKYGDNSLVAQAQDQLGLTLIERGDYGLAEKILFKALDLARTLDEPRILASINTNLAYLCRKSGQPKLARNYIDTSIKIEREIGDLALLGQALVTLAEINLVLGEPEAAFKDFEEAISLLEQTGQKFITEKMLENYAEALKSRGHFEKALEIHLKMANLV